MNNYKEFLIYKGKYYSLYFHAVGKNISDVYEYYKKCDDITRVNFLALVERIAEFGKIYDITKFRIEDKFHKIYAFKPKKDRFFCFFFKEKQIIITSAYNKKSQKLDKKELKKAIDIKNKYKK